MTDSQEIFYKDVDGNVHKTPLTLEDGKLWFGKPKEPPIHQERVTIKLQCVDDFIQERKENMDPYFIARDFISRSGVVETVEQARCIIDNGFLYDKCN